MDLTCNQREPARFTAYPFTLGRFLGSYIFNCLITQYLKAYMKALIIWKSLLLCINFDNGLIKFQIIVKKFTI